MAWFGQPVLIEEVLFKPKHGIVDQSLHARMGAEPTNGDGFGLGWYGAGEGPAVYRSVAPAWGDPNLRELAAHIESPLFLTHVRAAIGSPVQETNCHPFRHGRWLFVHNGFIAGFHLLRRDLMLAIEPALFADVHGSTDTEVVFHLALTFGLEQDPIGALAHVALPDAERRLGQDRDSEPVGDRLSLVVDRLDQPADALGHALLVEQEASVGSLEQPGVQQRHRGMNHRVAVQRGLEDARGFLGGRPDVFDEPASSTSPRSRPVAAPADLRGRARS
jgi:hypothetical protein